MAGIAEPVLKFTKNFIRTFAKERNDFKRDKGRRKRFNKTLEKGLKEFETISQGGDISEKTLSFFFPPTDFR